MAQKCPTTPGRSRIGSIADLVEDLKLLQVSPTGYDGTDVNSMVKAREERINELERVNGTLNEGYLRILQDLKQTQDRRHVLNQYYLKIKEVLQETRAIRLEEKADFLAGAKECNEDLENNKYTVLIAGETSAGKSSLINLVLNDQVLPTSILQNTLTICEISYGSRKEAVVHFAKRDKTPLRLRESKFDKIRQYIEKPIDDEHRCEKIEIKIPNPLLQGGVVIVDSPGIGDSEHISKIVLAYMPQACAFVYVINSPNAGGLQEDRLLRIVKEWKKLYEGAKRRGITPESALFVCNKWDEVERQTDQTERAKLQTDIVSKLKEKIPYLDEKTQVIRMSVSAAAQVQQNFNVMNDDLNNLIKGIQRLVPLCIERKTEYFYDWISGHLTDLSDQVKADMKNAQRNRKERLQAREEVEKKLEKLKQGNFIQEIDDAFSDHVKQLSGRVKSFLQSDNVKQAFCTWTENDMPRLDDRERGNLVKLKETYKACIEQRLESFLQKLENKKKIFEKAHADLDARFHRGFFDFENDIREIDRALVGESMDEFLPFDFHPHAGKLRPPLDPRVKKFLIVTLGIFMPVLFPIGLAAGVLSAPAVFGYLAVEKHLKEQQLKNDSCQVLTELSTQFLQAFIEHEAVNRVLQEFSAEKKRLDSIKRCHQELIAKYEQRCKDLTRSEDEATGKRTLETHGPLYAKLQDMSEKLMFDSIQHGIRVMYPYCQIDKRRLYCDEKEILGRGSYGTVFKGKLSPPGHGRKDVAVKKLKETPDPSNVASFLSEAAMLMELEHKHIVAFYGVIVDVHNQKLKSLALVFELCKESLKNYIFKNNKCIPWKTASAAVNTYEWSRQILDALEFIHSKNVVHRDLKLDNVLISRRDHIKVADLGLATFKNRITGTMCGTPLYMAPEVHEGKVYDSKADIFSFGIMMYEMWFGKRAPLELRSLTPDGLSRQIHVAVQCRGEGYNAPPEEWIELMASCCDSDPCLRRTAVEIRDLIKDIKQNYVTTLSNNN